MTLSLKQIQELAVPADSKIILLVMDGLGGLPDPGTGLTELEAARTPNLDRLAAAGMCGLHEPVSAGIIPGSGPGHLGLFGYDPVQFLSGRGVLEGLGIGFPLQPDDLAARGNFCTVDSQGLITDRRAGRLPTAKAAELCRILSRIKLPGTELFVQPVREHRFLVVFRRAGLIADLEDTDPERVGSRPYKVKAITPAAAPTAEFVQTFIDEAQKALAGHSPANMILLRGISKLPVIPQFNDVFHLRSAAVAIYPMYKGLARLIGMNVFHGGDSLAEGISVVTREWANFDFFFLHFKKTDAAGEDGDYARKVAAIEEADALIPQLLALKPDVIAVTGDHSTPAAIKSHSWHSVPFLISSRWCRPSRVTRFSETACASGNWKMNTTVNEAVKLVADMLPQLDPITGVEKLVCPPFISLAKVSDILKGSSVLLGAQNMYFADKGAFTGEISPLMLTGLCQYVILGHSERRQFFRETSEQINQKISSALKHSLKPILCVGENLRENEVGITEAVITTQVKAALRGIPPTNDLVIAYEPVWAIGTGKAASGKQAANTIGLIRSIVAQLWGLEKAGSLRILYGGSVTAANIAEYVVEPEIDGALVGGASLKAADFTAIVNQTATIRKEIH